MLVDLSKYSSLRIGKVVDVDIIDSIDENNSAKYKNHYIIGGAYNILFSNNPPPLAMLSDKFDYIKEDKASNKLIVGAKTSSISLFKYCKKNNIKGFEFLYKLPGSIGGLVFMNAGLKDDEICPKISSLKTSSGDIKAKDMQGKYSYRNSGIPQGVIIYEASFDIEYGFDNDKVELYKQLRSNQPKYASAGSCFKNIKTPTKQYFVAKLLDEAGLKGESIGDMQYSSQHCNFLINKNKGSYEDAIALIELAKSKVKQKFNIDIELEIKIV